MCCDRRPLSITLRTSRSFGLRKIVPTPRWPGILCAASNTTPLAEEAVKVCRPVRREQRRHRALNPFESSDAQLLAAVNRGEWALKGFRNRDIRALLFGQTNDKQQQR